MRSHSAAGKSDVADLLSPKKSQGREKLSVEQNNNEDAVALTIEVPIMQQGGSKTNVRSTSPKRVHRNHAKNKDQTKVERKIQKLEEQKINLRDSGEKESSKDKKIIKLNKKLAQYQKKCDQVKDQHPH
eukprot:TRINITY_DN1749_c0_g1_i1.p2 TRINITY_DN1749_c0_g1~~TRINITY_DN1749_c0_g1_i1.p2  ORF type:complete len:129 (+),score=25.87 TRINITY_DN1749_c0_g1_i1:840-1226(+)